MGDGVFEDETIGDKEGFGNLETKGILGIEFGVISPKGKIIINLCNIKV